MRGKETVLEIFNPDFSSNLSLPYYEGIKAGFPSPASDYIDLSVDLNKELIKHPASTFFARVVGDSMQDVGLLNGDILIVDKSLNPLNGDMVVCFIDGEFTVKFFEKDKDVIWLKPANEKYSPIRVTKDNEFMIWGVVTYSFRNRRKY